MKPFLPFLLIFVIHLASILAGSEQWAALTKPLLISSLLAVVVWQPFQNSRAKWLLMGGLLLSLTGDVLLIFQQQASIYFMLGLGAFLLAHICYIFLFLHLRKRQATSGRFNKPALFLTASYAAALLTLLFPKLGGMAGPVTAYAIFISIMFLAAVHAVPATGAGLDKWGGVLGAGLFVASDSLLAINKFYQPFQYAGFAIMLTYGLAQLLITYWAVKTLKKT